MEVCCCSLNITISKTVATPTCHPGPRAGIHLPGGEGLSSTNLFIVIVGRACTREVPRGILSSGDSPGILSSSACTRAVTRVVPRGDPAIQTIQNIFKTLSYIVAGFQNNVGILTNCHCRVTDPAIQNNTDYLTECL
jgi:hypothetical protein